MNSQFQNIYQITTKTATDLETILAQININKLTLIEKAVIHNIKIAITILQEVTREIQQRINPTNKDDENGTN